MEVNILELSHLPADLSTEAIALKHAIRKQKSLVMIVGRSSLSLRIDSRESYHKGCLIPSFVETVDRNQ